MDHAEVRERIEAATAGPGGLTGLVAGQSPEVMALRDHVRDCEACSAEWRAWSVISLGLAAAAPEELRLRPAAREAILGAVLARPQMAAQSQSAAAPVAPAAPSQDAPAGGSGVLTPSRTSGVTSRRLGRSLTGTPGAVHPQRRTVEPAQGRPWFRLVALGAAAAILVFVVGAAVGRQLGGSTASTPPTTGGLSRVMGVTADILQGQGYSLAHLVTPDGSPGGFVAVSPGSGELVVASTKLTQPVDGGRYVCILERNGQRTPVGYMHFEDDLAYWAGPVDDPVDIGLAGDVFVVQLDAPDAQPALTGTF